VEKTCIGAETVTGFWAIFFVSERRYEENK
jgi:hypothetical protein